MNIIPLAVVLIVYLGIVWIFFHLALRVIRALERIAESVDRISNGP